MQKIIFLFVCLLFFTCPKASAEEFMTKALSTWIGYSTDDIINAWGFPTDEKNIVNRHILIWVNQWQQYTPKNTYSNANTIGNYTTINSSSYGGYTINYICEKKMEIDNNNKITGFQWYGNGCPRFYSLGSNLVNPQNDPWEKARLEKIALKQKKKQEKLELKKQKKEQKIKRKSEKNKNKKQKSGK